MDSTQKDLKFIFDVNRFESIAEEILPKDVWKYVQWRSERGLTYQRSEKAYSRILLKPSLMVDVSDLVLSTTLLGQKVNTPIGISPTAFHKLYHQEGEIAVAKAVRSKGATFILSSLSDCFIHDVCEALKGNTEEGTNLTNTRDETVDKAETSDYNGHSLGKEESDSSGTTGLGWMQMNVYRNRQGTLRMVREAEECGMKALVVTVDMPKLPWGKEPHDPDFVKNLRFTVLKKAGIMPGMGSYEDGHHLHDSSVTWTDFSWLVRNTSLPVVAKGVLTPEDAMMAVQHGARGILVSAHGGRLLDGLPAPLEVLPEIVDAVGDKAEVYIDGGVRYGSDVFKALALGARAVFIGRPIIWGLTVSGSAGVSRILDILHNQLDTTMALAGCKSIQDITKDKITQSLHAKM